MRSFRQMVFFSNKFSDVSTSHAGVSGCPAPYDWMRDGVRVECKSSQLSWCTIKQHWKFHFCSVKMARYMGQSRVFDELQLVLYSPRGIHVYHPDLALGVASAGVFTQTEGYSVVIRGPRNVMCWSQGLDAILSKLDRSGCRPIAFVPWD